MSVSGRNDPQKERRELVKIALRLPESLLAIPPAAVNRLPAPPSACCGADVESQFPDEWWRPLAEWITDEAKREGFEAGHHGMHFLLGCVVGRLRAHHAATMAAAGATQDQVLSMLWEEGDTLTDWPRSAVATPDDRASIGTILRPTLEGIIVRGDLGEQIHGPFSRRDLVDQMPPLLPPFNWEYLHTLASMGGCALRPRFHAILDFVAAADLADFEGRLLGTLHPAALYGLLATQETSEERLLGLLGHPNLSIVAVALLKLLNRFQIDPADGREAREPEVVNVNETVGLMN